MKDMTDDDAKWQAESDASTLKNAAMIHADPKRHKAAMEIMMKEMAAMESMMEDKAKKKFPNTYKEEK